ncbi:hypothetical protein [Jiella sp. M17.18]|uniref:hypothetical protein n=1 Tax=Jiella sp. M17.18 TaxID=3234247 RepID=UPI0034DF52B1
MARKKYLPNSLAASVCIFPLAVVLVYFHSEKIGGWPEFSALLISFICAVFGLKSIENLVEAFIVSIPSLLSCFLLMLFLPSVEMFGFDSRIITYAIIFLMIFSYFVLGAISRHELFGSLYVTREKFDQVVSVFGFIVPLAMILIFNT